MLNNQKRAKINVEIISLLEKIERPGIPELIKWLVESGFFTSPASTKHHGCYTGGLANHSLNVLGRLNTWWNIFGLAKNIPFESIVIASLLHDVCKVGAYIGDAAPYQWNKDQPAGHAELSIERIEKHIQLTEIELLMIRYHMGPWAHTSDELKTVWNKHPVVKLLYIADELATIEEQVQEGVK